MQKKKLQDLYFFSLKPLHGMSGLRKMIFAMFTRIMLKKILPPCLLYSFVSDNSSALVWNLDTIPISFLR